MPEPLAQDPAELVRRWTTARPVPGLPADLTLHQADDVITLWERTEQGSGTPGGPPFWAFAWAGGSGWRSTCSLTRSRSGADP